MPLAAAGHLRHVIWVRPPWSDQLQDGTKNVKVGFVAQFDTDEKTRFACSWPTEYYTSDGTFARETDFDKNDSDLSITTTLVEKLDKNEIGSEKWFLDIDLDYYTVDDPFVDDLGEDELKKVSSLFSTGEAPLGKGSLKVRKNKPIKPDHCPIEEHEKYQKRKFDKLARFYKHLKEWDANRDKFDDVEDLKNVDTDINELFRLWKEQRLLTQTAVKVSGEEDVIMAEGQLIYNAGCTTNSDGSGLPVNRTSEEKILKMIKESVVSINSIIEESGLPEGICFARSSLDGYCPPDQVEFVQSNLLTSLNEMLLSHNTHTVVDKKY